MHRLTFKFPTFSLANFAANTIRKQAAGEVIGSANGMVIVECADDAAIAQIIKDSRGMEIMREAVAVATPGQTKTVSPAALRLMHHKVPMFFVKQFSGLRKKKDGMPGSRIMWSKDDQDLDVIAAKDVQSYIKSGWVIIETVEEAWEIREQTLTEKTKLTPDQLKQVNQGVKAKILAKKQGKKEEVEEEEEIVEDGEIEEAKEKYLTGPGKKDPKRITGIYTMKGKWIKDMGSEKEAANFVNKSWGESVEEATSISKVLKAAKKSVLADRDGRNTPKAKAAMAAYKTAVKNHLNKEDVEVAEQFKAGDKVKVPHKGKMVSGKIVRFDNGGTGKAQQHGGGYVVDVGEPASITVPKQKVQKEEVELDEAKIAFKKILSGVKDIQGPFMIVVMKADGPGAMIQKKVSGAAALPAHINHMLVNDLKGKKWKAIAIENAKGQVVNVLHPRDMKEEVEVSESATKRAIENFMYSIPKAAIAELKSLMKQQKGGGVAQGVMRLASVTAILNKHGVEKRFMGFNTANLVNDHFETFFGESVEENEEVEVVEDYKAVLKGVRMIKLNRPVAFANLEVGPVYTLMYDTSYMGEPMYRLSAPGKKPSGRISGKKIAKAINDNQMVVAEGFAQPTEKQLKNSVVWLKSIINDPKKLRENGMSLQDAKDNLAAAMDMISFGKKYGSKIKKEEVELDEAGSWGGGFETSREAQAKVQAGLRADAKREKMLKKIGKGQKVGKSSKKEETKVTEEKMYNYIAFYSGKKISVQAPTSFAAQQKAAAMLKVSPKKQYMITVKLSD
jgi:hypothetical protein